MSRIILVVEDDTDFREIVVELLQRAGHKTLQAAHGKQAVELLANNQVDLVLSDIKMPVMDGLELLKHLQTMEKGRPQILMMTGYSIVTKEQAINDGAVNLIDKTTISENLLAVISSIRFY